MSLVRWYPFHVLGRSLPVPTDPSGREGLSAPEWAPVVDVAETSEEYLVQVELPGVPRDDVKVSVEEGVLRIEGERRAEKEEAGKRLHRVERSYGSFVRSFVAPDDVDAGRVTATFKDGVLSVHLPKSGQAKPRTIEVRAA